MTAGLYKLWATGLENPGFPGRPGNPGLPCSPFLPLVVWTKWMKISTYIQAIQSRWSSAGNSFRSLGISLEIAQVQREFRIV